MTTLAMLIAACVLTWNAVRRPAPPAGLPPRNTVPVPSEPVRLTGAPSIGSASARVAVIEFSDFECPFCGRFSKETLPEIKARYIDSGKVRLVFRHLPLTNIHPRAVVAAEAAECAGRQGRFWEMHDRLFSDVTKLATSDLAAHASAIGLDMAGFTACVGGQATERVREDAETAKALQLGGTPAFLLGVVEPDGRLMVKEVVSGARSAAEFAQRLDALLMDL